MRHLLYYLLIPFIYFISWLPFSIIYLLSDLLFLFLFNIIGYRRKIVRANLINSFPEKPIAEINKIEKDFYHFFCDLLVETIKTLSITKAEALERCRFKDPSIFNKLYLEKRSIIIVMGHYGNWEWAGNSMTLTCNYQLYVIYKPLANKKFNDLIVKMRTRFGTKLYPFNSVLREMIGNKTVQSATAFISDQTPSPEGAHWLTFLNQDTPVFQGTEKIARKLNYPVVYATVHRHKRGYYDISLDLLCENPKKMAEGEITKMHTSRLEKDIYDNPAIWLWTHRRWKHKRKKTDMNHAKA